MTAETAHPSLIDERGWHRRCRYIRSPNFDARPADAVLSLIVVHCISLPRGCYGNGLIGRFFANRLDCSLAPGLADLADLRVSSHFLIDRFGRLSQFVSCADRAWHAGESAYRGRQNCNDFSVGIELEGRDDGPYTPAQYLATAGLAVELMRRYPAISAQSIVGHEHIAPARKSDPGTDFDWSELARQLAAPAA